MGLSTPRAAVFFVESGGTCYRLRIMLRTVAVLAFAFASFAHAEPPAAPAPAWPISDAVALSREVEALRSEVAAMTHSNRYRGPIGTEAAALVREIAELRREIAAYRAGIGQMQRIGGNSGGKATGH